MKYMIMHYASQADIDATNVAHGLGHGSVGAAVAAWLAVALVGFYELLMIVIRNSQSTAHAMPVSAGIPDPLCQDAVHVGQPRAQRLREFLAIVAETRGRNLTA